MNSLSVHVVCGVYCDEFPVAGMTVGQTRRRLAHLLEIAPHAAAVLDGREADEATILAAGQTLVFVRYAGEIG